MSEKKIKDISRFCDEWCEHCAFTSRCSEYVPGKKTLRDKLAIDPKLTKRLRANLEKATQLFEKILEETNIERAEIDADVQAKQEKLSPPAGQHLLTLSGEYFEMASAWLKSQPGMIERLQQMITDLTIGTETPEAGKRTAESIKNELAIINWNAGLIQIRILESGLRVQSDEAEFVEGRGPRSDGVAKSALCAMERSLEAWKFIFDLLPEREDDLLRILAQLQKLKEATITEFPDAMNFKRPGFDD